MSAPRNPRLFSTAARVHPPPPHFTPYRRPLPINQPNLGRVGRLYLPAMAVICLGFAAANATEDRDHRIQDAATTNAERTRRHQALLDAYGDRMSLHDVERALEVYEGSRWQGSQWLESGTQGCLFY